MSDEDLLYYLLNNNLTHYEDESYDEWEEVYKLKIYNLLDDDHIQVRVYVDDELVDEHVFGIGE